MLVLEFFCRQFVLIWKLFAVYFWFIHLQEKNVFFVKVIRLWLLHSGIMTHIVKLQKSTLFIQITPCWNIPSWSMSMLAFRASYKIFTFSHLLNQNLRFIMTANTTTTFYKFNDFLCFRVCFFLYVLIRSDNLLHYNVYHQHIMF